MECKLIAVFSAFDGKKHGNSCCRCNWGGGGGVVLKSDLLKFDIAETSDWEMYLWDVGPMQCYTLGMRLLVDKKSGKWV